MLHGFRGHNVQRGKMPVLDPKEAGDLLNVIDLTTPATLRARALIGLMVYGFAPIGAALAMRVEDAFALNRRLVNHASTRTTRLYDRRSDEITPDEVERVLI